MHLLDKGSKDELEINLPWQMFRSLFCFFQSINNVSILLRLGKLEKKKKKTDRSKNNNVNYNSLAIRDRILFSEVPGLS